MHDGTTIINNTFVWNGIGLQNGQHGQVLVNRGATGIGWSKLNLVNNIFDTYLTQGGVPAATSGLTTLMGSTPTTAFCNQLSAAVHGLYWLSNVGAAGSRAFEGVHINDLHVMVLPAGVYSDFNAYEYDFMNNVGPFNTGFVYGVLWASAVRPGPSNVPGLTTPVPFYNIGQYTGFNQTNAGRGILFIRDLLCNGARSGHSGSNRGFLQQTSQPANPNFDGSPLDFRLAPVVTVATTNASPLAPDLSNPNTSHLNPLVDAGFVAASWTMANGQTVTPPGILLPITDPNYVRYAFDNWQWDMEGFGNPRIFDHPKYQNVGQGDVSSIDLGADELGELIIAGYRFGTTSFHYGSGSSYLPPLNASQTSVLVPPMDNRYAWYIGPRSGTPGVGPLASNDTPAFRAYKWDVDLDGTNVLKRKPNPNYQWAGTWLPWYSPPTVATGRYRPWRFVSKTAVGTCTIPSTAGTPTWYLPTLADITPHLMPDVHPWWQRLLSPLPSNPIWQPCPGSFPANPYNIFLYVDPNYNRINPPGTYLGGALASGLTFNYLDLTRIPGLPSLPPLIPVDFPKLGQLPFTFQVFPSVDGFDIWCLGYKTQGPSTVSRIQWPHTMDDNKQPPTGPSELLGIRFSLEHGTGESGFNGAFWSGENGNLQTFLVYVQEEQQ